MGYRNHKLLESGRTGINMGRGIKAVRAAGRFFWQLWKKIYHRWYDRGGERNHPLELRHKKHPGLWDYLGDPKRDQRSSKYAVRRQKRLERRRQRRLLRRERRYLRRQRWRTRLGNPD